MSFEGLFPEGIGAWGIWIQVGSGGAQAERAEIDSAVVVEGMLLGGWR